MPYSKLGRTSNQRRALLRQLATALLAQEKIETTEAKAQELRSVAEALITLAKQNTLHARRQALAYLTDESVTKKLFDTIAPRYAERPGGFTRVMKLGPRRGDAGAMALIELV